MQNEVGSVCVCVCVQMPDKTHEGQAHTVTPNWEDGECGEKIADRLSAREEGEGTMQGKSACNEHNKSN